MPNFPRLMCEKFLLVAKTKQVDRGRSASAQPSLDVGAAGIDQWNIQFVGIGDERDHISWVFFVSTWRLSNNFDGEDIAQ